MSYHSIPGPGFRRKYRPSRPQPRCSTTASACLDKKARHHSSKCAERVVTAGDLPAVMVVLDQS
ncbi:Uncharacterised protein [Mycobacteroides abscessus subsp. abscessus]|nr:Uncharacterised protein [Mycobacteroides abscessus subsp. abscessus]